MADNIVSTDTLEAGNKKRLAERKRQIDERLNKVKPELQKGASDTLGSRATDMLRTEASDTLGTGWRNVLKTGMIDKLRATSIDLVETLAKPDIKGLLEGGLLPVDLLNEKITVLIPAWPRVRDNDNVRVIMDEKDAIFVGTTTVSDADEVEFPVSVNVLSHYFTHGSHTLQYIVDAESGSQALSFPLSIVVDREAPTPSGSASLPDSYNNTIRREDLDQGEGLTPLNIPPYLRMEAGDTITVYWTGATGMGARLENYLVTDEDVTNNTITVDVPKDVVENGGEGAANVYYYIQDRAGNRSIRAPDFSVAVILNPAPSNLAAPYIPLADTPITDADTREPVKARIPKYTGILPGDIITLRWRGNNVSTITLSSPIPSEAYVTDIVIPRSTIWASGSGTFEVDYVVTRGNVVLVSPSTSVEVDLEVPGPVDPDKDTDENEALLPLTVHGNVSEEDNKLLPQDLRQGAVALVPWYGNSNATPAVTPVAGEIIRVYWGGRSSTTYVDYTVTPQDVADAPENFVIDLPASIVDVTPETPNWPVTYDLINKSNTNLGMTSYVNVHLIGAGGPDGLRPVVFLGKNARGWLIEGELTNPTTSVLVRSYDNMFVGDIVTLHWVGNTKTNGNGTDITATAYSKSVAVEQINIREGVTFAVPHSPYILGVGYGSVEAYYTIEQGGLSFESERDRVKVDMEGPAG